MVHAYILIQTEVGKAAQVATTIAEIDGVTKAEDVTGPYDVIVRAEAETRRRARPAGGGPGAVGRRHHPHADLPGGEHLSSASTVRRRHAAAARPRTRSGGSP